IAIFDESDRLEMCNQRYRDMYPLLAPVLQLGTSFETICRAYVDSYVPLEAQTNAEAFIQERLRTHRQGGEWVRHLRDGRYIRIVERELSGGKLATLLADVTELAQARVAAESASRAKSEFLTSTSHEIRTPLNAILGLTYMLERADLPPEQHGQVRQIAQAGRSLLSLVSDVLDLSKIEAGQLEVDEVDFDLRALVGSEMALHAASAVHKALHTACEVDPNVPALVHGDVTRLRQILGNLLSNAMKFTEKGAVTLRVRKGDTEPWIELTVTDTGMGIEPSVQARLFRPFEQADATTTRRFGGTGLGLAICAKLVKLMNGSMTLSSQPGQGSSFTVTLPLPAAEDHRPDEVEVGHTAHIWLSGIQILVVDDSSLNLDVARLVLELEGACVYTADSGEEALRLLKEQGDQFDVVLLDVQMPLMDGYEVAQQIRKIKGLAHLPVVALSAGVTREERERALHAGMNDFLSKPLDPPRLIRCVRGLVGTYRDILIPVMPRTDDALKGIMPTAGTVLAVPGLDETHIAPSLLSDRPLLLSMLSRLLDEFGDLTSLPKASLPAALHKLRGSAVVMGAIDLAQAASEAEAALTVSHGGVAEEALARVSSKLTQLKESSREVLAREAERLQAEQARHLQASGGAEPLTATQWTELRALLTKQSARSLQRVEELSGPLLEVLGPERLGQLRTALNAFDFELAVVALGDTPPSEISHG
ncbi:MAG TPA: ATP-binding protein, partial [Aquabacterium sp.]|nr:ATP-binding protein [Aquabacterium sp.]